MKPVIGGKSLAIATAVFVLLIFLHSVQALNFAENFFFGLLAPVQQRVYDAGLQANNFVRNVFFQTNKNEVELLKAQLRSLMIQNAQLKIAAQENILLKKELGFTRRQSYQTIAARIIGYDSLKNSNLLILQVENEKYKNEDVLADMPIIIEDGILIGKVAEIKDGKIFMRLITSPQSAVAATVLNKNYTIGVAEGEFNFGIKMRMIPQSEKIKQGDLAVSSGLEPGMPKGLLLGTVSKIEHDPQNPFDIAHIAPLYNQKDISKILIISAY